MSKSTINLYVESLRPKVNYVTLANLGLVLLVVIVLAALWRGSIAWQQHQLEQQRSEYQAQMTTLQQQLSELAARSRAQRPDPELEASVSGLEREIRGLQSLSSAVLQSDGMDEQHYARVLRDLSAIHQHGLWLHHIEYRQGRLILRGQTEHSGHLPRWMARFNDVPSLAGKQFAVVALERESSDVLSFEIRSQREQEVGR